MAIEDRFGNRVLDPNDLKPYEEILLREVSREGVKADPNSSPDDLTGIGSPSSPNLLIAKISWRIYGVDLLGSLLLG